MSVFVARCRNHREQGPSESGFTLIELLVVIVIIGILAGLAVGIFLSQRQKGYDAAAKSDLRSLSDFEEIYLDDYGTYGTINEIKTNEPDVGASRGDTLSVVDYIAQNGYCLSAKNKGSPHTWFYDSQAGGLQPSGTTQCPVTIGGTPGDSITNP